MRTQKRQYDENGDMQYYVDYIWEDGKLQAQYVTLIVYVTYKGVTTAREVGPFTSKIIYDESGVPQGFMVNDAMQYAFVRNLQGDVIAVVDQNGATVMEYSYDPWGNIEYHLSETLGTEDDAMLFTALCPLTYRGYNYDFTTGLYYLQSRYYNPEWGRFINCDDTNILFVTKDEVLGSNLFAYCDNNPVNCVDYTGYAKSTISGGVSFYYGMRHYPYPNDDSFFYDASVKATLKDRMNWKIWGGLKKFASKKYPQGAAFYNHYRSNKGGIYNYDYTLAYNQDSSIRQAVNTLINMFMVAATVLKKSDNTWYTVASALVLVRCNTMNWKLALGGHQVYIYGNVYYNSKNKIYTANYTIMAYDRYNFDGNGKNFYGIPDSANGRFVTLGWAKFFNSVGIMSRSITWRCR